MAAVGRPYVCLYCAKNIFHSLNLITKKYWNKKEKHFKNEQKVAMLQKAYTRGVGISNMRKSICKKGAIVCVLEIYAIFANLASQQN